MEKEIYIDTDADCSADEFRMRFKQPKQYRLFNTTPVDSKNDKWHFSKKKKTDSGPMYFQNLLREQRVKMFVNTFARKLKSSVVLSSPPQSEILQEAATADQLMEFEIPRTIELGIMAVTLINTLALTIFTSLTFIFSDASLSAAYDDYIVFSVFVHLLEMAFRLVSHQNYEENKVSEVRRVIEQYVRSDFAVDCCILVCFVASISLEHGSVAVIARVPLFLKLKAALYYLKHLEVTLLENVYNEQIWGLVKVFIFNFMFAHLLTLLLVEMSRIDEAKNWVAERGLQGEGWVEIYIWGYYWATTIMLTVGFGDLTPVSSREALCMVFIEMTSCILLAYNINQVGMIVTRLRSYEQEKLDHFKTFRFISERSDFSAQTRTRIMNFIRESAEIKRNFSLSEEERFIGGLPASFRGDLLKEMNRHVWNGMKFFQNLSEDTLAKLAQAITKKLAHPEEVLHRLDDPIHVLVFSGGGFGYSFNRGKSPNNGRVMQHARLAAKEYRLATLDFLHHKKLTFDIVCTDYAMVYSLSTEKLVQILQNNMYDLEYFFMVKDKDKYLRNEFELWDCDLCPREKHSVFKCPKLHYMPLAEHVVDRHKQRYQNKLFRLNRLRVKQDTNALTALKQVLPCVISARLSAQQLLQAQKVDPIIEEERNEVPPQISSLVHLESTLFGSNLFENCNPKGSSIAPANNERYIELMTELKDKMFDLANANRSTDYWDLEVDAAFNFRLYFRKFNPEECSRFNSRSTLNSHHRRTGVSGYRPIGSKRQS